MPLSLYSHFALTNMLPMPAPAVGSRYLVPVALVDVVRVLGIADAAGWLPWSSGTVLLYEKLVFIIQWLDIRLRPISSKPLNVR